MPKPKPTILEKLTDSRVKSKLLMLLHRTPGFLGSLKKLAEKIEEEPEDIKKDVESFKNLGILQERHKLYTFSRSKDREIRESVSSQLAHTSKLATRAIVAHREKLGVDLIDGLLIDEYPLPSANVILGPAGTGKSLLCQQIVNAALAKGHYGIYVALDDFPETIRESMSRQGVDVTSYEETGKLVFVDCYSPLIGVKSSEKYYEYPSNLTALGIIISEILAKHESSRGVLVVDSLTSLIHESEGKISLDFLRSCVGKLRYSKFDGFFNLNPYVFHHVIVAAVQEIMDGVIQMRTEEEPTGLRYYVRISKMRARYLTGWVPYTIDPERGLVREWQKLGPE